MLKILILILLLQFVANAAQKPYGVSECGLHGRFEYCIDDFPGCIVGCHCHPGFYFDTDTKICESSSKMFQERRFYNPPLQYGAQGVPQQAPPPQQVAQQPEIPQQPEIAQQPEIPPQPEIPQHFPPQFLPRTPTPSELLTEIKEYVGDNQQTENEDGLEEWLYKQFSKTVESQVLNKNGPKLTRRSGGDTSLANFQRHKTSKSKKGSVKKKQPHKLRAIDENDSIFDDVSSEEDDGSGGGGAGGGGGGRGSGKGGGEGSGEKDKGECKSEGKKMIIIKKAPKMPLPPFIFMPQVDGSYFPANGLVPPPPMTLFPIVPVPPMMPMPMPMMPPQNCNNTESTTESSSSTTTTPASAPNQSSNASSSVDAGRKRGRKRKPNPFSPYSRSGMDKLDGEDQTIPNMQQLQQHSFNPSPIHQRRFRKKESNGASDELGSRPSMRQTAGRRTGGGRTLASDSEPDAPAPGFQYLTDLIHTFDSPTKSVPPMKYNSFGLVPNKKIPTSVDDTYFTNLGKEIVTLMSKMDKRDSDSDGTKALFNSKGAWDRQVRSPSPKNMKLNKNKSDEDLTDLEKEVYAAATSAPALSLAELEEEIRKVDEEFISTEPDFINEEDAILLNQPATHLNVNLLESANRQPVSPLAKEDHVLFHSGPNEQAEEMLGIDSIKTTQPIASGPIQSELKHSEPSESSATVNFELRGSDPKPSLITPIRPPNIRLPLVRRPFVPPGVRAFDHILITNTSSPTFKSASISSATFSSSQKNHHMHIFKNQKDIYKKSQKRRHRLPKTTTPLPTTQPTPKPRKDIKYRYLHYDSPYHLISKAAMHIEPRYSQANYSAPTVNLKHKPHSLRKNNHPANISNQKSHVETYNSTTASVFGGATNFGYNLFQPSDLNEDNAVHPSSPPSKAASHRGKLTSSEKWEFDKQRFYYPKLTVDLHEFNKFQKALKPRRLPMVTTKSTTKHPVALPVMSPVDSLMNSLTSLSGNVPMPLPIEDNLDAYPNHQKLYKQYFFPIETRQTGVRLRNQEVPSWYFDTK